MESFLIVTGWLLLGLLGCWLAWRGSADPLPVPLYVFIAGCGMVGLVAAVLIALAEREWPTVPTPAEFAQRRLERRLCRSRPSEVVPAGQWKSPAVSCLCCSNRIGYIGWCSEECREAHLARYPHSPVVVDNKQHT